MQRRTVGESCDDCVTGITAPAYIGAGGVGGVLSNK